MDAVTSRRGFLSTVAAAPAAAMLPAITSEASTAVAPAILAPPAMPSEFYVLMDRCGGQLVPELAAGSLEAMKERNPCRYGRHEKPIVKRWQFVPLASEWRYVVAFCEWKLETPDSGWDAKTEQEKVGSDREWDEYHDAMEEYPNPRTPISLPPAFSGFARRRIDGHYHHFPEEILTREEGFVAVAEFNNASTDREGDKWVEEWAVLIEFGEPLPSPSSQIEIESNGIGIQTSDVIQPVRVVIPSDEEYARHDQGWKWHMDDPYTLLPMTAT